MTEESIQDLVIRALPRSEEGRRRVLEAKSMDDFDSVAADFGMTPREVTRLHYSLLRRRYGSVFA